MTIVRWSLKIRYWLECSLWKLIWYLTLFLLTKVIFILVKQSSLIFIWVENSTVNRFIFFLIILVGKFFFNVFIRVFLNFEILGCKSLLWVIILLAWIILIKHCSKTLSIVSLISWIILKSTMRNFFYFWTCLTDKWKAILHLT